MALHPSIPSVYTHLSSFTNKRSYNGFDFTMCFLFQILNEIAQHKIKIYEFPDCDDEEEKKAQKKLKVS